MAWQEFEVDCVKYLNDNFGKYALFTRMGGEDSTIPDIKVECKNGCVFNIEVKYCPAQCGQFVLLPDDINKKFAYSIQNNSALNNYSQNIMTYMDSNMTYLRKLNRQE